MAKALYVTKRARPDISLAIAFLTTRVRSPDTDDWEKLSHLVEFLRGDQDRPLILGADNEGMLMWCGWVICCPSKHAWAHRRRIDNGKKLSYFSIHQTEVEHKEYNRK